MRKLFAVLTTLSLFGLMGTGNVFAGEVKSSNYSPHPVWQMWFDEDGNRISNKYRTIDLEPIEARTVAIESGDMDKMTQQSQTQRTERVASEPGSSVYSPHSVWQIWFDEEGNRVPKKYRTIDLEPVEARTVAIESGDMDKMTQQSKKFSFVRETKTYDYGKDREPAS